MDADFHLKLLSKKLQSGRCQVKFQATVSPSTKLYGYFLANPDDKLKDVVDAIHQKLTHLNQHTDPFHAHLFCLGKPKSWFKDFIIYPYDTHK
ncbi:MAG: hypothetical protein ACNS62_20530 [Candidatus Cyclobacteriaceae bacterium M3_2C_046]